MKKLFSVFLVMVMIFSLSSMQVFAAEVLPAPGVIAEDFAETVEPRGSLSGYGQKWYNSGSAVTGTFTVNVSGIYWPTAQLSLSLESFASNVCVQVIVYRPNGSVAFNTADTSGTYMTMANSSEWQNIPFVNGQTGTYTVWYSIWTTNGSTPSSGRINCWIY